MARLTVQRLLTILAAFLAVQQGAAQKCYYPNGEEADPVEKPCSKAEGSACCPPTWECLDNGLCRNPNEKDLYGRYSCTDKEWRADGCPRNLCTYDMNAVGGESITQCSNHDDQWCCNADTINVNCCQESPEPRPFFRLQDGEAYATIGRNQADEAPNLATITGSATSAGNDDDDDDGPSSTPAPTSSDSDDSSDSASTTGDSSGSGSESPSPTRSIRTTPITSVRTEVTSGSAGVSTIELTSVIQPSQTAGPDPTPSESSDDKSNIPVIVGCAVGIPLGLALLGILIWLFRKRSRQNKEHQNLSSPTPDMYQNNPSFAGGANFGAGAAVAEKRRRSDHGAPDGMAELPGQSVGPERPVSAIQGKAELGSGNGFAPGAVPYAPDTVGLGGGNGHTPNTSWGTAPPGYSPGQNQAQWSKAQQNEGGNYPAGLSEAPDTSVPRPTSQEVPQQGVTAGGRYIPYRPPPGHRAAELPTVRTPPEERGQV